jgi:hypothetical protein
MLSNRDERLLAAGGAARNGGGADSILLRGDFGFPHCAALLIMTSQCPRRRLNLEP